MSDYRGGALKSGEEVDLAALAARCSDVVECDAARVSRPLGSTMFLIVGFRRDTRDDPGQWYANGDPVDFEYFEEHVVASGGTPEELLADAKEYAEMLATDGAEWAERVLHEMVESTGG